jgi:hypothetical protein
LTLDIFGKHGWWSICRGGVESCLNFILLVG